MKLEPYKTLPDGGGNDRSPPPVARFTLDEPLFAGKTFDVRLNGCDNPCCHCELVRLECQVDGATAPIVFEVNVMKERLDTKVHSQPNKVALGKAFCKEADAEDWQWLRTTFVSAKREKMETMDLDTVEVDMPEDIKRGTGTMVDYMEIFPWAEMLTFMRGDEHWVADDRYCVRPGCPCKRAFLTFFCVSNASPSKKARYRLILSYDYRAREIEEQKRRRGSPEPQELMEPLMAAHPDLASRLSNRHEQLKRIARRFWPAEDRVEGPAPHIAASGPSPSFSPSTKRVSVKVGRNEPCPCGSGKKFKKCCGTG